MLTEFKRQPFILILGVGNRTRRDDGAGLRVAELVKEAKPPNAIVDFCSGEMTDLLDRWKGFEFVILIDAAQSAGKPGRLQKLKGDDPVLGRGSLSRSSHEFGVAEALRLSRVQSALPSNLILFALEGEDFSVGEGLTASVQQAVARARDEVLTQIVHWNRPNG